MNTRIIHRLYMGDGPAVPSSVWEQLNPGWEVREWGEESILIFEDIHSAVNSLYETHDGEFGQQFRDKLSSIIGYAIIRDFGGVFVGEGNFPISAPEYSDSAWYASPTLFGSSITNDPFWTVLLSEIKMAFLEDVSSAEFVEAVSRTMPGFLSKARAKLEAA